MFFIVIAAPWPLSEATKAFTTESNQQMEHIQYWIWAWLSLRSHLFNVLNSNSCFTLSPLSTDAGEKHTVRIQLDEKHSILCLSCFSDVDSWANVNQVPPTSWIHLKHYRTSLHSWLLSHHSSALKWIMHHSLSSSLPESAAQLLHPVLPCWFFTFPHSFTNATSFYPSLDKQTLICHRSHYAPSSLI